MPPLLVTVRQTGDWRPVADVMEPRFVWKGIDTTDLPHGTWMTRSVAALRRISIHSMQGFDAVMAVDAIERVFADHADANSILHCTLSSDCPRPDRCFIATDRTSSPTLHVVSAERSRGANITVGDCPTSNDLGSLAAKRAFVAKPAGAGA